MSKIFTVARAEYSNALRSKAFIIGVAIMPILMFGLIGVQAFVQDHVDTTERKIAIIDQSGFLYPIIESENEKRTENELYRKEENGEQRQIQPKFSFEEVTVGDSLDETKLELSKRVRNKELLGYLVIAANALEPAKGPTRPLAYHTNVPSDKGIAQWTRGVVDQAVKQKRFEQANLDRQQVGKLMNPVRMESLGLVSVAKDGTAQKAKKENEFETFGIPIGSMVALYMLVIMTAPTLLNQVLEEKIQKISEVLVSSVSPFQLLMGKLFGTIGVAVTLSIIYLGAIYGTINYMGYGDLVDPMVFVWFLPFLLLALFMYGSIFSAIGAACSEIKDAQSLMTPAMLLVMLPMFTFMIVVKSPNGLIATLLSLFPPCTPMIMMLRINLQPGPPVWQVILAIILTGICTVLFIKAAAKIFRIGILSQGQSPTMGRLIKWALSK